MIRGFRVWRWRRSRFFGGGNRSIRSWKQRLWRRKVIIWSWLGPRGSDPTRIWSRSRSGSWISGPGARFTPDPRSRCRRRRARCPCRLFRRGSRRWRLPTLRPVILGVFSGLNEPNRCRFRISGRVWPDSNLSCVPFFVLFLNLESSASPLRPSDFGVMTRPWFF